MSARAKVLLRLLVCAPVVSTVVLMAACAAQAQQYTGDPTRRKTELEIEKLQLEISRLRKWWLDAGTLGFAAGAITAAGALWAARRARRSTLDQSVHDRRLDSYAKLVKLTAPLAIYFPAYRLSAGRLTTQDCSAMGSNMSTWYFSGGGLLLSTRSRDAYFRLVTALMRAGSTPKVELKVPRFPDDFQAVTVAKLGRYRKALGLERWTFKLKRWWFKYKDVEDWKFGAELSGCEAQRFRDYVFLQQLGSALRGALADDLKSRRQPT